MFQKILTILLLILSLLLSLLTSPKADPAQPENPDVTVTELADTQQPVSVSIQKISKHGNVTLDTTFDALALQNIEVGDIITVFVGDAAYDLPVGTSYSDVDSGSMICRFDREDNEVTLAVNMGAFATVTGLAEKQTINEDPGYRWEMHVSSVGLLLKEKGGYLDIYTVRNLTRTDDRADYPFLSDAAFANFREVTMDSLKANTLYRSSSPLDPSLGRSDYAMAAMEQAGIRTVINLTDSAAAMQSYSAYPGSFYSRCAVIHPEMGYDFETEAFAQKVKDCVLFILDNDGPYLVHCKEGKDRTGVLCAVLECFAGASAQAVKQDYMETYVNFYGVQPDTAAYDIILNDNLVKTLCALFGVDSLDTTDLHEAAARYLRRAGLSDAQLDQLSETLCDG